MMKYKTATPQDGQAITMEYDLQGNRTKLTDPDAGVITSKYDGWGQLIQEEQKIHVDANPIVTTYNYFPSGLLRYKQRNGDTTNYSYDNLYRLKWVSIAGKHSQGFDYDQYDRIIQTNDTVDESKVLINKTEYDLFGRVKRETYPGEYYTENKYDNSGHLTQVTDRDGRNIWQPLQENARGQIMQEKKGDKTTDYEYDVRSFISRIYSSGIQNNSYGFNAKGNLTYRNDYAVSNPQSENFDYDNLNRLTNWNTGSLQNSIMYSDTGNIQRKSDIGGYTMNYGANGKPHALTSISGIPDNFPANYLSVTYTDFKKIKDLTEGNKTYSVTYGVDDQRLKSVYKENGIVKETRYYLGNYEEKIDNTSNISEKIYYLGNAIYIERSNGTSDFYHVYTDYQGSLTVLVRENGVVAERYAYDPWGRRRNPENWTQPDNRTSWIVNRGYTMHEHIDRFGIINMNGRVYDPLTAQFFSTDPYLQSPGDWLNFNRYSYALNNPFKYTDPSGEFIFTTLAAIFCPPLLPLAISTDIGWITGGLNSKANGGTFWQGAILGGTVGAFNGAFSMISPLQIPFGTSGFGLNIAPQIAIGTDGFGIGFNATLGFNYKGFNAGVNFGGTYYASAPGTGESGLEGRIGYGIGYKGKLGSVPFELGLGSTYFSSGETSQLSGQIYAGLWSVRGTYENDTWIPVPGLWDKKGATMERDRYRTAALRFDITGGKLKGLNAGLYLYTGLATKQNNGIFEGGTADDYRMGVIYVGYDYERNNVTYHARIGYNSEKNIRGPIQNWFHDINNHYPHFKVMDGPERFYFGNYSSNPYTLW